MKKSEILLFEIVLLLFPGAILPEDCMACLGKLVAEGAILHPVIELLLFPVVTALPKYTIAQVLAAPSKVQFVTVLLDASFIKLSVMAFPVILVFEIISVFPPLFNPSMVTSSAPVRLSITPLMSPVTEAAPTGIIFKEVQGPTL